MLKIRFKECKTPFVYPFQTAHGVKTHQEALLVAVEYNGIRGIGESPVISYYPETMDSMITILKEKAPMIESYAPNEPKRFWHFLHHLLPNNPFLVCALDLAYWDLYSQLKNKSIRSLLALPSFEAVHTDYTLGLDSIEKMKLKIDENPWPIYKIKVNNHEGIKTLRALSNYTDATFRIDANASWSYSEARDFLKELEKLKVELIEQPLAKGDFEGHTKLKELSNIPIIADESFQGISDLEKCSNSFDGINIKLTKCSGLSPALEIIEKAKEKDLKIMLGCMSETEIGTYPAVQIASLVDYVDLDGPMLLETEPSKIFYKNGMIQL